MSINYIFYEEIDSTNNEIKRKMAEEKLPEFTVISAGRQTGGRGRSGHNWESPKGVSIATSMALYPREVSTEAIPRLTLIAAVAVAEALEKLYGLTCKIKWPNDILVSDRKICGILTELSAKDNHVENVVVGIGVNVHNRDFPEEIKHMAISVDQAMEAAKKDVSKVHCKELTEKIWDCFLIHYREFLKSEDLTEILKYYNEHLINKDRMVQVLDPLGAYEAVAKEMTSTGELLVEKDGQLIKVDSGEVSVRGIYGYV